MMNTELQRLVKGLIDSDQCYICGTRLFIEPSEHINQNSETDEQT